MSQEQQLGYLQQLLHNLPESTGPYHDIQSTNYHFSVSDEEIEEYGDETSATNRRLEINFGPHHQTNGIVLIVERGPGICAVVSTLLKCPLDDVRIELWVNNLCSSAEKLYAEAGKKVRGIRLESYTNNSHELQLPEILAYWVPEVGKKRKASILAEVIDITGQDTEDEDMPVNAKYFHIDCC